MNPHRSIYQQGHHIGHRAAWAQMIRKAWAARAALDRTVGR